MQPNNELSGLISQAAPRNVSAAAGLIRTMEVAAQAGNHPLAVQPRTTFDQLELRCCASCASASAMECLNSSVPPLSPLFHYHVSRFDRIPANSDGTLTLLEALNTLMFQGITTLALYSPAFTDDGAKTPPTSQAYQDGLARALVRRGLRARYSFLSGPSNYQWIRDQLRQQRPVLLEIFEPEGYPESFLDSQYIWASPEGGTTTVIHTVFVTGVHDLMGLRIHDSRGSARFDGGEWWMSPRVADSNFIRGAACLIP